MEILFPRLSPGLLARSRAIGALKNASWTCQSCRSLSSTRTLAKAGKPVPKKVQQKQTKPVKSFVSNKPLEYKARQTKVPPPPPPPRPNPFKNRMIPIVFGGISLVFFAGYGTYLYVLVSRDVPEGVSSSATTQPDVSSQYDKIATTFDSSVDFNETLMRLPSLRRKLVSQAKGDILEVSIGTGRNLEYYDWDFENGGNKKKNGGKVRSFTAVDKSGEMLEIAHEKFSKLFPGILGVRWIIGDAEGDIPPPPKNANERSGNLEGKKYDTVVQTMGLCSVSDPVGLLRNLGKVVKEDEGRILLLEHGRGDWKWLNKLLDRFAEDHAKGYGCWWNRDLGEIVGESGLEVVQIRKIWWHGGTTWWIELKKPKTVIEEEKETPPKEAVREQPKQGVWRKWLW